MPDSEPMDGCELSPAITASHPMNRERSPRPLTMTSTPRLTTAATIARYESGKEDEEPGLVLDVKEVDAVEEEGDVDVKAVVETITWPPGVRSTKIPWVPPP